MYFFCYLLRVLETELFFFYLSGEFNDVFFSVD